MKRLVTAVFGLAVLANSGALSADEVRKGEEARKAEAEAKEARERELRAEKEEKQRIQRQEKEARTAERERHGAELKERLTDLRNQVRKLEAENTDEARELLNAIRAKISETERQLRELAGEQAKFHIPPELHEEAEKLEQMVRRVHHMHVAAENLMAAEMPDLAHELKQRAEAMQKEIAHAKEELMARARRHEKKDSPEANPEMRELRHQNEQLKAEIQELRRLVEELKVK